MQKNKKSTSTEPETGFLFYLVFANRKTTATAFLKKYSCNLWFKFAPSGAVTDAAYAALIELVADICKRNGIKKLLWKADRSLIGQVDKQNMTVHRWFANKACPGDYLYQRHGAIAEAVNAKLGTDTEQTVSSFPATPFTVRVIINDLNYRDGPSMSYAVKGQTGKGVFTITEVQDGWGKLKSGAGWIYLENPAYCTILDDGQTEAQKATEKLAQDIAAQLKSSGCDAAAVLKRVSEILA